MSTGSDLVAAARKAREVYQAGKQIVKDLDAEADVAKKDLDRLADFAKQLGAILDDLPTDMSKQDRRRFIAATKATINERLKYQDTVLDFEERLKLNAQLFTLENQELKLDLLDRFDVRSLLDADALAKLQVEIDDALRQIVKQVKARGFVRLAAKLAILAIDLGVLVAKAAA
jgi:hypothetical protein